MEDDNRADVVDVDGIDDAEFDAKDNGDDDELTSR